MVATRNRGYPNRIASSADMENELSKADRSATPTGHDLPDDPISADDLEDLELPEPDIVEEDIFLSPRKQAHNSRSNPSSPDK